MTLAEAKATIENYLGQFLMKPEVSVDVAGFNSKVYYIVTDAALGDEVCAVAGDRPKRRCWTRSVER